ncbi:MAG: DNA polymerase III, subunit gamma and tau [Candidatus Aminicenantes bacterium RBG_19FT_COMBO_59_29]|nr:MAG: DNA polymerase III, subunit gamma and tau [Candidatus Aminicenantes bacterium RBG_19FT_COMBO_59_29]
MAYVIFARKYRPKTFEEVVGQAPVVQTLQNAIRANRVGQAYIFAGMRGTGKTTVARILAKALNCQHGPTPTPCNACEFCNEINEDRSVDVLEIDGASSRTVDDIGPIRDTAKYKPIHSRYKIIYIDEVHMLSAHAFNALLKTLEEPPERTVFIFATTEFHKLPETIVSRCQHFEFKKISQKDITNHLLGIAQKENITISPNGLSLIAQAAEGSLRDAQSLLDQAVAFSGEVVQDEELKIILGSISREILFECSSLILAQAPSGVFALVEKVMEKGYDLRSFYKELIRHFRDLMLVKSVREVEGLLPLNPEELEQLRREADKASLEDFLRYLQALQQAEQGLRFSSHAQIYLETLLVKLCHFQKIVPLKELLAEVQKSNPDSGSSSAPMGGAGLPPVNLLKKPERKLDAIPRPEPVLPPSGSQEEERKNNFRRILAELQKEKSSLAAILSRQASFRIKDEPLDIKFSPEKRFVVDHPAVLEISFPGGDDYYREAVHRDIRTVERIASEVFGQKIKVRLGEGSGPREIRREKETDIALKDPSVQAFMDIFKATILSVEPLKGTKERE